MKREQIVNTRVEIAEKIHEELLVSLELERKLLKKELTLQETMTERVVVRKDLGIRNYPESCMERMLSDDQVHGI